MKYARSDNKLRSNMPVHLGFPYVVQFFNSWFDTFELCKTLDSWNCGMQQEVILGSWTKKHVYN